MSFSGAAWLAQADAGAPFHPQRDIAAQNAFKKRVLPRYAVSCNPGGPDGSVVQPV
jgi:hypothetical protein